MSDSNTSDFNRKAYDRWSNSYDSEANSTICVDEQHFPPTWKHLIDKNVLEIGCGTGRHTLRLAAQGNSVTAIEPSPGMLEVAKNKISSKNVKFILGNFLNHDQILETPFDAVLTSLVLEHIEDLPAFFGRVSNCLKVGGEFFLSEIHPLRIASGSQAHFLDPSTNEEVRLKSFAHSELEIRAASSAAGLSETLNLDVNGDETLAALHSGWEKHLGKPMLKISVFQKSSS